MDSAPTLASRTAAPDYLLQVTDSILRIENAGDPAAAVELLEEASARMGADAAVFVSFMSEGDSRSAFRFLVACDPLWLVEYERLVKSSVDPWLTYASTRSEAVRACELIASSSGVSELERTAARFGFRSAVIVPVTGARFARFGALYLGSDIPGYFEAEGYVTFKVAARMLGAELHDWWLSFLRKELLERARLTDEELALLAKQQSGIGSKRIARELGVSLQSVNSRFQRLNGKLQVRSRRAAARLASEHGLI